MQSFLKLLQENEQYEEEMQFRLLKKWQDNQKKIRNEKYELFVISKQWFRSWKCYYELALDQAQIKFKPASVNSDLRSNEKFLFQYPGNHVFNQSIVELEKGDYILVQQNLMESFKKSYGADLIIRKQVWFDLGGTPQLQVNLRKQEVYLQTPQIQQGKIQVDQDCFVKNWIQMLKLAIQQHYKISVEGIRLWRHKHYPAKMAIEQLQQNNGKFHGEILEENQKIGEYQTDLIIIDIQQNGQWQYTYLDLKLASKLEFQHLYRKGNNGCGKFLCSKNYCKSNPVFRDIGFDTKSLQTFLIELFQEDAIRWDEVCWNNVKDEKPIQKLEDINEQNLIQLSRCLNSFGASFVNNFSGDYDNLLQPNQQNSFLNFGFIEAINKILTLEMAEKIQFNLFSNKQDVHPQLLVRAIYIFLNLKFLETFLVDNSSMLAVISDLSDSQKNQLSIYLEELPYKHFTNLIKQIKHFVSQFLKKQSQQFVQLQFKNEILYTKRMFDCLSLFYKSNQKNKKLHSKEFVVEAISTLYPNNVKDYLEYRQYNSYLKNDEDEYNFTFCLYPWAIPLEFKNDILTKEAKISQRTHMQIDFRSILRGQSPYLAIEVDRENLLESSLKALNKPELNYKSPLKVIFAREKGVDEGGPKREFFSLLIQQLFDLNFGMFVAKNNNSVLWFNKDSVEMPICFELIGILLGLALYNQVLLELRFPPLVYKKLMNEQTTLEDLRELDLDAYKGFNTLVEYEKDDFETVFSLTFAITDVVYGEAKTTELLPGGELIPVTQQNKKQFIQLYSDYLMNGSIEKQFSYFKNGFWKVVQGNGIKLFTGTELQTVIVGLATLNMKELELSAEYQGYDRNSDYIITFWAFIHSLSIEDQKKFLLFCTGSDRVPVGGLKSLKFLIQKHGGGDSEQLPTAHTCFNVLLLPQYDSAEKMVAKLQIALNNCEGFGLI